MWIFRDQTTLSVTPKLWQAIQSALEDSEYFLLFASEASAKSPWVNRELTWWLNNRGADKLLLLLTDGNLQWDNAHNDFDWTATTSLPVLMKGTLSEEPLYLDLRWAHNSNDLSMRHTRFRAAILEIVSTLTGISKDVLDSDEVAQHRRIARLAWTAGVGLFSLSASLALATWYAIEQRDEAIRVRHSLEVSMAMLNQQNKDLSDLAADLRKRVPKLDQLR